MANSMTIKEAKGFFIKNPPHQFKVTDSAGNSITRWLLGTSENVSVKFDELENNSVYEEGIYFVKTRTGTAKNSHSATFEIIKGNLQAIPTVTVKDKKEEPEKRKAENLPIGEILTILSENKILQFKVETLEKTIEHLNHEIDRLEEEIEAGHHEKTGMNEGLVSALVPLGERLLTIIESRGNSGLSEQISAPAPAGRIIPMQPGKMPAPDMRPRQPVQQQQQASQQPTQSTAPGSQPQQASEAEQIAAIIIQRVENDPNNPNALADQMIALNQQRPDIYEEVTKLITAYYSEA